MVHINAGALDAALAVVVGRRMAKPARMPLIVSLVYDRAGELTVSEARHGARRHLVAAQGVWPDMVQLDGRRLQALVAKYPPDQSICLIVEEREVTVLFGKSRIALPRTDHDRPAIKEKPLKPDPRHRGKVEVPPDPATKRVALADTWLFSARVPMPQHRTGKKGR
jgi:hypothetical protein